MLRNGVQNTYITRRVNMPTGKSHAELVREVSPKIKAQAFFSARVAEAHILDRLREVSDGYSRGEFGLGEARNRLKDFLKAEGYDPHKGGLKNLASTARLNLILKQNAAMAHAAGEWQRMHDPDAMKVFPFVRYHCRGDSRTRSEHADLDGRIFHKNDPFLRTHTPPWEFNCRCYLEEITAKEAGKTPDLIQPETPEDQVTVDSKSGFSFDPEHAFEQHDVSHLQPMSRASILRQAEEEVKNQTLGNVGMIVAPAKDGDKPVALPGLAQVKNGFEAMKIAARQELESVGLDPDHLPVQKGSQFIDYHAVNQAFKEAGKQGKNIVSEVKDKFPTKPFVVGNLCQRAAEAAGLEEVPVFIGPGNSRNGIEHLWRNHKELFADPDQAVQILRETLGNENCRVVVSLKRMFFSTGDRRHLQKIPFCLKRIVLHNPSTQSYCVTVWDGQTLKLVSWNRGGDNYGNNEWRLE